MISDLIQLINSIFEPLVDFMAQILFWDVLSLFIKKNHAPVPLVVIWLFAGSIFFTLRFKFINLRAFRHAIQIVLGSSTAVNQPGEVSQIKALSSAVSGTVGLGNIAGVAIAISIGGPGATFWMILAGFFGMSMKFAECTLAVKYREIDSLGKTFGGPMYYIKNALERRNMKTLGSILGTVFAALLVLASLGGGNMFQSNQAFSILKTVFPTTAGNGFFFGLVFASVGGFVIIGGIRSISNVASKLVPFMGILYIFVSLIVIIANLPNLFHAIKLIIVGAFSPIGIKGGLIGVMINGIKRAVFSNEAGVGSSPVIHATARTDTPVKEGIVAMLEPFIDTIVICTMTALVIIFTGFHITSGEVEGVSLTTAAFSSVFSWAPYFILISVFLFAFSSLISWSYYGLQGFVFLFGGFFKNKVICGNIFNVIFLFFTIVGSSASLSSVLDFSDMMLLTIAFPNILIMLFLSGEIAMDLENYLKTCSLKE